MNYFKEIFGHSKWTASAAVYSIFIQAGLYLFITRYISVEDIGIYALASSFVFVGITILDSSFNSSLIHTDKPTSNDYQSVWALNTRTTFVLAAILLGLVLIFQWLSDKGNIFLPATALAPLLLLSAFNSVHFTGLKKNMRFKALGIIDIVSTSIQFIAILVLAFLDFGFWALVIGLYIKYILNAALLIGSKLTYCSLSLSLDRQYWVKHYTYGKYIISEKGLSSLLSYSDIFLIGHFLGYQQLGIYDILKKMVMRPILILYSSIEQIIFPLLSNAKNKPEDYNKVFKEFCGFILILFFPALMLIYAYGYFVLQLFPPPYSEQSILLGSIVLWACTMLFLNPIDIILYSLGRTRLFFKWFLSTYIIQLVIMWLTVQIDLILFIKSISLFNIILWIISYKLIIKSSTALSAKSYFQIGISSLPLIMLFVVFYPISSPSIIQLVLASILIILFITYHIRRIRLNNA
ncbi:MAG: oligosaccharide flippase family protein [Saprospiraceae bacterium]|nr:oligosaccharide flippase family protein [Saprospiraceae bacterium]